MTAYERVLARLPTVEDGLLRALLADAEDAILAYLGLDALPAALQGAQAQLAIVYYNRLGIEGETSHAEGGVRRGMEALPKDIEAQIRPWRVARVVNMHAAP